MQIPKNLHLILAAGVVVLAFVLCATKGDATARPDFGHSQLTVTRADGKAFPFAVEIATNREQQAYGLMFIKKLAPDAGMIFPYSPPREIAFWMKNTLIPLDMLFIRPDGTIGRIVTEAQPQDLTPIPSQEPVSAVIEIKGGMAKTDGFATGDKVQSPALAPIGQ